MNIRFTLLAISLLSVILPGYAENTKDKEIFRAMNDEFNRSKNELKLSNYGTPFYLGYYYRNAYSYEMEASLGALLKSYVNPSSSTGAVRLIMGDYKLNSEIQYGKPTVKVSMPNDGSYNMIRHNFWLASDVAYKQSNMMYANKVAYLQANPLNEEYANINDFTKISPINKIINTDFTPLDKNLWEQNIRELSAIFNSYPDIFNSNVRLIGMHYNTYQVTSDSIFTKIPNSFVMLDVIASTRTDNGIEFRDTYSTIALNLNELPNMDKLKKEIKDFADNIIKIKSSKPIEEYYSGPILFEAAACANIFTNNLLNGNALFASKPNVGTKPSGNLEKRIGKKIIDSRLSVKNYSSLDKYNGVKLIGAYEVDAEGIIPQKELSLVEEGILKVFLNKSTPTPKSPLSTGSARYALSTDNIESVVAPGTIHISSVKGKKQDAMKKALIKAAKEEGLTYAYIVRRIAGESSLVYKVDVKTGDETMVRSCEITPVNLQKLKRLLYISSKEQVSNYILNNQVASSIICPYSIIVEDAEISTSNPDKQQEHALEFPLKRK